MTAWQIALAVFGVLVLVGLVVGIRVSMRDHETLPGPIDAPYLMDAGSGDDDKLPGYHTGEGVGEKTAESYQDSGRVLGH